MLWVRWSRGLSAHDKRALLLEGQRLRAHPYEILRFALEVQEGEPS